MDFTAITNAAKPAVEAVAATTQSRPAEVMTLSILQLAVILVAARVGGMIARRYLRLPGVLGELLAGVIIGPFALGRHLPVPGLGQSLFPLSDPMFPVSPELYALATIASIVLLFLSGLETDLATFLRYSVVGTFVGIGGVVASFVAGAVCAVFFHIAPSLTHPSALFLGTISTATSVGITARVLAENRKMSSPEGVAILAGAVIDDMLGIVLLAVVVGLSRAGEMGGHLHWEAILFIGAKAIGFWLLGMAAGILLARRFANAIKLFRSPEAIAGVSFGAALLLAGLSEMAGLAMIIGAYLMGLSLSRTDIATLLQRQLEGLYNLLVPVFFCVMGMLVDLKAVQPVLLFGIVYSVMAILAKIIGCALPPWLMQFNGRGALRIGIGMVPRGEVALIVAGIGLAAHAIPHDVFGVAVMMTLITTLIGPPLLGAMLTGASGLKNRAEENALGDLKDITLSLPSEDVAVFLRVRLVQAFRKEDFFVYRTDSEANTYQIRKDDAILTLTQQNSTLTITVSAKHEHLARLFLLEEMLALQDLAAAIDRMRDVKSIASGIAGGLYGKESSSAGDPHAS